MTAPEWRERAAGVYVAGAVPVLAFYALMVPVLAQYGYEWHPYTSIAAGAIGAIGTALRAGWVGPRVGALALALVLLAPAPACRDPYLAAYQSLASTRAVALATSQGLADTCRAKADTCLAAHRADRPGYLACVRTCEQALEHSARYLRPAVNTGLLLGLAAIDTARAARTKVSPMAIIRPIACALARALGQWGSLLPPSLQATARAVVSLVDSATCPKEAP